MESEQQSLLTENGELKITVENRNLEEKYQELLKEIEEKTTLMDNSLEEKNKGADQIQASMAESLTSQEEDMKK